MTTGGQFCFTIYIGQNKGRPFASWETIWVFWRYPDCTSPHEQERPVNGLFKVSHFRSWKVNHLCLQSGSILNDHFWLNLSRPGTDVGELRAVIEDLLAGQSLKSKHRDHQLFGNWEGHRDCHIEPDWVLIYRITNGNLYLERTGSHSELFKKWKSEVATICLRVWQRASHLAAWYFSRPPTEAW